MRKINFEKSTVQPQTTVENKLQLAPGTSSCCTNNISTVS